MRFDSLGLGLALALALCGAHAALYKWVDDKGVIQYSDKPPDSKAKGGVEMSKRGLVVKKLDTALTPEQQKAKDEEEARRKAEEHEALVQRRADFALLQSFSSAQEIDLKRDRELQSLEAAIANLRTQERTADERLSEDRKRLESYAKQNKSPSAALKNDIARDEAQLKLVRSNIEKRQQEMAVTRTRYDELKKRYLELRQQDKATAASAPAPAPVPAKK